MANHGGIERGSKLTQKINHMIVETIEEICKEPLRFLSETDIHVFLMSKLLQIPDLRRLLDTGIYRGEGHKTKYRTIRVHKEYGHADKDWERSDIVILPEDLTSINIQGAASLCSGNDKNSYLPKDYIFEFGTERTANSPATFKSHLEKDINKVKEARIQGYIVDIHRNFVNSPKGTEKRNENDKKILKNLSVIKTNVEKFPEVHFIFIVIDVNENNENNKIRIFIKDKYNLIPQQWKNIKIHLNNLLNIS